MARSCVVHQEMKVMPAVLSAERITSMPVHVPSAAYALLLMLLYC